MAELDEKLAGEWQHWETSHERLVGDRPMREAWLRSEVAFISGLVHRAAGVTLGPRSRILQVGAGPIDVIDLFDATAKHAIDPLADRYRTLYRDFQDRRVTYAKGVGEKLPYAADRFDLVVVRNALDHVYDPVATVREIHRVLAPGGALYVWIYLYDRWTSAGYRFINAIAKSFETEPWAFTLGRLEKLLVSQRFELCHPRCIETREKPEPPRGLSFKGWIARTFFNLPPRRPRGLSCVARPIKSAEKAR